jgi:hypothetical protein
MVKSTADYLLKKDRLIGHKLVVQRKGLIRLELSLKDVYYNQLIGDLEKQFDLLIPHSSDPHWYLSECIDWTRMNAAYFLSGGRTIFETRLERRVYDLELNFVNQYLRRAKKILDGKKRRAR